MASAAQAFAHVEWDPERFGIGIRQIDEQHKTLIQIINRLSHAVQTEYNAHMTRRAARERLNTTSATIPVPGTARESSPSRLGTAAGPCAALGHGSPKNTNAAGAALNKVRMANSLLSPLRGGGMMGSSLIALNDERAAAEASAAMAEAHRLAQEPADAYTPASHLRSFPSCYQQGSVVGACLADLVGYCLRSLTAEDHILETYTYPDRATQMQEHEAFGEQVCRYHRLCETFALEEEDLLHLLIFLKLWVRDHIPRDRRYAPLLLEKGIGV